MCDACRRPAAGRSEKDRDELGACCAMELVALSSRCAARVAPHPSCRRARCLSPRLSTTTAAAWWPVMPGEIFCKGASQCSAPHFDVEAGSMAITASPLLVAICTSRSRNVGLGKPAIMRRELRARLAREGADAVTPRVLDVDENDAGVDLSSRDRQGSVAAPVLGGLWVDAVRSSPVGELHHRA